MSSDFLERQNKSSKTPPPITDEQVFRKRYNLEQDQMIYVVIGGYKSLKKALNERGFYENTDRKSPVYNFKFAIKSSDCFTEFLQDN